MRCLVVHAHPLPQSLTRHFCDVALETLRKGGYDVEFLDLYQAGFDPRLTATERATHHDPVHDHSAVKAETDALSAAELVVLVFPTWWFGLPAIMKGWIDRVFAPGVGFAHGENFGPIKPLLGNLKQAVAITTLGSPWWIDTFVMRRPVRNQLKSAVFRACAPQAKFSMLSFHLSETATPERVAAFDERIVTALR